ncbi:MAG: RNA-directed DNA polymerase [Candidatus Gastranaerophilales bacterium]|nr:RNA-directed DNA polymerase [Candidatus Gastranaerophilales bacterium]
MQKYFKQALDNIARYGDTDIFPYTIEKNIFFDLKEESLKLLEEIHTNFDSKLAEIPPINENTLAPSSYTGFRIATQIDPIWNAYLLGLVLSLSKDIEKARLDKKLNKVFSYRIKYNKNTNKIFDEKYGYNSFLKEAIKKAKKYKFVLSTDIADFYSRVYHHKLENALDYATEHKDIKNNIIKLLSVFSNSKSYGLPIGGQASRILAEICLNNTDQILNDNDIDFCRFVDDYYLFGNSEEEIYEKLILLSDCLITNEGLPLQKSKTKIISAADFISSYQHFYITDDEEESKRIKDQKKVLLTANLRYDPYSQTAEEDYEKLKKEISKIDIMGILLNELSKTRIHSALMKKTLRSIKVLSPSIKNDAILTLINPINFKVLYPVMPHVLILMSDLYNELTDDTKEKVINALKNNIKHSYIFKIPLNMCFSLKIIAQNKTSANQQFLTELYKKVESMIVKKEIILIMAKWEARHWLINIKNNYAYLTVWEKRTFIIASFFIGDEGKHWREHNKNNFNSIETLWKKWGAKKKSDNKNWEINL